MLVLFFIMHITLSTVYLLLESTIIFISDKASSKADWDKLDELILLYKLLVLLFPVTAAFVSEMTNEMKACR